MLIAVVGLVGGVLLWSLGLFSTFGPDRPGALSLLPLTAMAGAELLRRTGQPWSLALGTAALAADLAAGSLLVTVLMFTDVVYAAVLYGPQRLARRLLPASVLLSVTLTVGALALWQLAGGLFVGLIAALVSVMPASTGVIVRNHRDTAAAERLRAEQTALLAEMDRAQAVTAERARMARELHDLVANHLSAIAIHSTAALSLREDDAAATRDALGVIRENSVQGLTEMRRLIGLLRDTEGAGEPGASPTLDGLDALLERARAGAGGQFAFALEDERDGSALPAPVELAAYRVVQESVTNALKHAAGGTIAVRLWRRDGDRGPLLVRVTSPLDGAGGTGPRAPGSGAGLIGMRERAELLGGTLAAGPVPDGGAEGAGRKVWEVRAELPVDGPGEGREGRERWYGRGTGGPGAAAGASGTAGTSETAGTAGDASGTSGGVE